MTEALSQQVHQHSPHASLSASPLVADQPDAAVMLSNMQQAARQASQLLKSLSHPDRLLLLCHLSQGSLCVSELEHHTGIHQPSLSQQLGVLRKDGLVSTNRVGKQIFYRVASDEALAVLQVLYQQYCPR